MSIKYKVSTKTYYATFNNIEIIGISLKEVKNKIKALSK